MIAERACDRGLVGDVERDGIAGPTRRADPVHGHREAGRVAIQAPDHTPGRGKVDGDLGPDASGRPGDRDVIRHQPASGVAKWSWTTRPRTSSKSARQ